jgi:hypothetical protein
MDTRSTRSNERLRLEAPARRPALVAAAACAAIAGAAALGLLASRVSAQNDAEDIDREVKNCINLNQIDHTDVVDDDTILFYMRGNEIYENDLPNRCPELRSEDRFLYRVSTSQLCNVDTITVLNDMGFGFMPGATCGLGKFAPISQEAADELLKAAETRRRR